jgi:hypothetical protein
MRRRQDTWLVVLSVVHGAAIVAAPTAPLIAIGVWWNSNTIAHHFVHRPFFRRWPANVLFALFQSVLLGIPQALWRQRHLAHHAGVPWRLRWTPALVAESSVVLVAWSALAMQAPTFFAMTYLPGYLVGLGLCAMQGHFEHARAVTTSHYGRVYNLLCFNDGYHCEHHAFPGLHWSELPARRLERPPTSRWPAVLRWLDAFSLNGLERLVLRSPRLQAFVVEAHVRAFALLLADPRAVRDVAIVGGGLFPRTVLVLRRLMPDARVVIIDEEREHLESARAFLTPLLTAGASIEFRHETFVPDDQCDGVDLVVVPLAFRGDRRKLYASPPAPLLLVHDWCWRPHGTGRVVSLPLFKRVNLVRR